MRRKLIILLTGAFIVLSVAGCGDKTQKNSTEVVNNTDATEYEVKEATPGEAEESDISEKTESEEVANSETEKSDESTVVYEDVESSDKASETSEDKEVTESKADPEEKPQLPAFTVEAKTGTKYATQYVNFRKGPSTDYDKAGSLSLNEEVSITGQANTGWYEFEKNGAKVYVSDKYLSDTKIEATQTVAKNDNATKAPDEVQNISKSSSTKETVSTQSSEEAIGLPEGDSGFPGLVKLDEDPEYITEVTSKEEAFADQIKANGWEVGGTYVEYYCNTTGGMEPACSKVTWYVVSKTDLDLVSDEVVTYEEYLAAGGTPVKGY